MSKATALRAGLLATAVVLVASVRLLPLSLSRLDEQATQKARQEVAQRVVRREPGAVSASPSAVEQWIEHNQAQFERERDEWAARLKSELSYRGADGHEDVYLGDYDSYTWLRHARTYLRTGTTCDAVRDGECRDTYANAPVGRRDQYHHSLHIAAIVGLHRLITFFAPDHPLPASSFLVPVIVGILGVLPAFAIGRRLGGDLAGWCAAVLIGVNPIFLQRSAGSDTDVWNLVLPLFAMWAGIAALSAERLIRQITYAVVAAAFTALHALTWSGWVFTSAVLLGGLLGNTFVLALRRVMRTRSLRAWGPDVRRSLLVLLIVSVTTGLLTTLAGVEESYLSVFTGPLTHLLRRSAVPLPLTSALRWPDTFATVGELSRPNLAAIADYMGGALFFFIGWLGLLVLVLPRQSWQWWHFALLIGGNFLYRYLLTATELSRPVLLALLALPLALAVAMFACSDDDSGEPEVGASLTMVLWFVAALFLSFGGLRFVMLLVPAFALACAVAIGRLHGWLVARVSATQLRITPLASPILFAALVALVLQPVRRGYDAARTYRPRINDAWWDTLDKLRDQTPPDSIVNTWWDYGYWVKYVAERRVSADGGSLRTHIPHWLGRALAASDERETIGLLRMLNCASDATPEPEGSVGAYGRLLAHGSSEVAAHTMVVRLAGLERSEARAYLTTHGFSEQAAAAVLGASHCAAPPAYLVLSSEMIKQRAWRTLGNWEPTVADGGAAGPGYLTLHWRACQQRDAGQDRLCPVGATMDRAGLVLDNVIYVPDRPDATRLHFRHTRHDASGGDELDRTPALVLLAGKTDVESVWLPSPSLRDLAVLIDVAHDRILVGPSDLLRSTFTQLMYLDGRYARHFDKFDDRTGYNDERVVTWKIDWDGHQLSQLPAPAADD